ncbi:MAG: ABC transporter ATP-binding protein [Spirochaetia bacterium]|nr:ABC transporter ATP-binding protein [Spirochaetia bacterium]MDD7268340.1 ABC transporter ATP-binding protein [Treponema sp.]MDY4985476.1 ABC transporter ATP-binding protein [Treponema sp.]
MYSFKIENLSKTYPTFKLDNISFCLEPGYIMGFIGRNGAGKTTTLKSMLKFVHPDCGNVEINGFDINTNEFQVKNSIGFVSGLDGFYNSKKIKTVSDVTKKFFPNWNETLYRELLQKFNLDEEKLIKSLSAGMKVKYQIALAMSHDAKLLILDEPTSGLDPVSRDELIILFQDYVADGEHSILFSTHVTSDLDKCADYITYIKQGKIIESTDIVSYKEKYFLINGKIEDLTDELKAKIIGFHKHNFGFEGMILASDKQLFSNCEITKPNLEDIMVHCER